MNAGTSGRIGSVEQFSAVVDALRDNGPLSSQAVADELDIAKSTAHAYLATMEDLEFVVRGPEGYSLGLKFLDHGMFARDQLRIVDVAAGAIEQLAEDTSEAVYLVVEEHGMGVYADYALGNRAVQTHARIGTRSPLHVLASGKAILANMPRDRVKEIIDRHGFTTRTKHTIDSRSALFDELDGVREQGYAVNEHEALLGTRAVGAPILAGDDAVGAIAVAGPANRITRDRLRDEVRGDVLATANEIELMLT